MVREISESSVPRPMRSLILLAAIGVIGLALSACGRKGGLDPPPGVSAVAPEPQQAREPEIGPDGRPVAPPPPVPAQAAQKRWTPIDWLID